MKTHQYELIDEKVFEHEFDNGLKLFVIPKAWFSKNVCDLHNTVWFIGQSF